MKPADADLLKRANGFIGDIVRRFGAHKKRKALLKEKIEVSSASSPTLRRSRKAPILANYAKN